MTEEIVVTNGYRELRFADRSELAEYVEAILDNGAWPPLERKCIERLAELSNGDAPPRVREIADNMRFRGPTRRERGPTPFDDWIEEQRAELEAREAEHAEQNARIREQERKLKAERWKREREAAGNPTKLVAIARWAEMQERELTAARIERERLDEAARRARAKLLALKKRRDKWHADKEARFVVEGRVVDLAGLHEWLAVRNQ